MPEKLDLSSEIARLKRVIVHTPGPEVEAMSPSSAEKDLFNDIVPLSVVQKEHSELKGFLGKIAKVHELLEILEESLAEKENRERFSRILCEHYGSEHRIPELASMDGRRLAETAIRGLPARNIRLEDVFGNRNWDIEPLPNTYFMRDAAIVFRDRSIASAMRFPIRKAEALIHQFIFQTHSDFKGNGSFFDGPKLASEELYLEGGDFLALGKNTVAIGVSERSSARAVDTISRAIAGTWNEPVTIFAVDLPVARATIHLDMTFTVIDNDACLVYEPVILGPNRSRVARIDAEPGKEPVIQEVESLLLGLKAKGIDLEPVLTGGKNSAIQDREQWLSGANSFAFAPGKIISYSCNMRTFEELSNAGFEIKKASELIDSKQDPFSWKRLIVGFDGVELARGGGGARCMTCPVERES